jgi:hypothetical protein
MFFDQVVQQLVHGQVAFFRHLIEDEAIMFVILVEMVFPDVEKRVMAETERLVDLKIETHGRHDYFPPGAAAR